MPPVPSASSALRRRDGQYALRPQHHHEHQHRAEQQHSVILQLSEPLGQPGNQERAQHDARDVARPAKDNRGQDRRGQDEREVGSE